MAWNFNRLEYWAIQEYTDHDFYDVYYQTENTIWIAGTDGLLIKTEDGGFNWDQIETNTTEDLKSLVLNLMANHSSRQEWCFY